MQGLLFILLILFLGNPTQASQAELFGLDAASSARAGSVTASPGSAFSSIFNPALLGAIIPSPNFPMRPAPCMQIFRHSTDILLPRSQREGDLDLEQDFQPENLSQLRWALGVSAPVSRKFWDCQLGFGATFSWALTPEASQLYGLCPGRDDFHFLHYGAADGQFKATVAGSLEILPESLFGTGIALYLNGLGKCGDLSGILAGEPSQSQCNVKPLPS